MLGGDHLLLGCGLIAGGAVSLVAAEAFSATVFGVMVTPRQPRLDSSSTAQISDGAEVSPGKRPITLVRRRRLDERALQEVRRSDPLAVLGWPAQVADQGVDVAFDHGDRADG